MLRKSVSIKTSRSAIILQFILFIIASLGIIVPAYGQGSSPNMQLYITGSYSSVVDNVPITYFYASWTPIPGTDHYIIRLDNDANYFNSQTPNTTLFAEPQNNNNPNLHGSGDYWNIIAVDSSDRELGYSNYVFLKYGYADPLPPYAKPTVPSDGEPVNLSTGVEDSEPSPDLTVYNPSGPSVSFQREYRSDEAMLGQCSPGLSAGWTFSYDYTITGESTSWGTLTLVYPNGSQEVITPVLNNGQPTGAFTTAVGTPYITSGNPSTTTGQWNSITITWKDRSKWLFTPVGANLAVTQITNRVGQSLNLTWNTEGDLSSISDATSGTTLLSLSYDSNGNLETITDAYDRQINYNFGTPTGLNIPCLQTVSDIFDPDTQSPVTHWTYGYTAGSVQAPLLNTISIPSPTGSGTSTLQFNYNDSGQITSQVDANGNQRIYTYNSGNTLVQVERANNALIHTYTQYFDSEDRNTGTTDASGNNTTVAYGDSNNPYLSTSFTDGNGKEWQYTYDQYGNLHTVLDPRNTTTTYGYNYTNFALGELGSITVGSKSPTTFSHYEPSGLVQTITSPLPGTADSTQTVQATFQYDSLGDVTSITAPAANNTPGATYTTTFNYTTDPGDSAHNIPAYSVTSPVFDEPLTATDNLGNVTHYRYNNRGLLITEYDALGNEIDYGAYTGDQSGGYDLADDPLLVTYPATGESGTGHSKDEYAYQYPGGPLDAVTSLDESGNQVTEDLYGYGPVGELASVTGSEAPAFYGYDADYDLASITDGDGNSTTYDYDTTGRLTEVVYPGATSTTSGSYDTITYSNFDGDGNPKKRIDGNDVETDYTYGDPEDLLTDIHYPGGQLQDTKFQYDAYGRRSIMYDQTCETSGVVYSYDDDDNLLDKQTGYYTYNWFPVGYTYYPDGSRETMTTMAGTFGYSYDGAGRMTSLTNPANETSSWTYYPNDWLKTQTLANGAVTTYTYDALGNTTDLLNQTSAGATISEFSHMAYNGAGDLTTETVNVPSHTAYNGTTNYTYDSISGIGTRNQLVQEASTRNGGYTNDYTWDGGSYSASQGVGNPTYFISWDASYTSDNQMLFSNYSSDGNGNTTLMDGATETFDPENRLIESAVGSTVSMNATYNGDNQRAYTANDLNGEGSLSVYDGDQQVEDHYMDGTVWAYYTYGPNGMVSSNYAGVSTFYAFDPQGGIANRLDNSQDVETADLYTAFGAQINSVDSLDRLGYGAQWGYFVDGGTGMLKTASRYYNQNIGRFLTRDPIGYAGGSNLYAYTGNNPVNESDPLGYWGGVDDAVFIIGGALLGVGGQAISDALSGQTSSWQTYAGAAIGGAAGGEALLYTGPVAAGAIGGAASNASTQLLNMATGQQDSFDPTSLAASTALGAVMGKFSGPEVEGVTTGRGNWNSIFKQMTTKFKNGQISNVGWGTAGKMFGGRAVDTGAVLPGVPLSGATGAAEGYGKNLGTNLGNEWFNPCN